MLPKQYRLPGHRIPILVKQGERVSGHIAVLIYLKSTSPCGQFAFIVPSRLSKKATQRNRTKRLLSEAVRLNLNKIVAGHEAIIMAKKILQKEKLQEVEPEIVMLFKNAVLFQTAKTI